MILVENPAWQGLLVFDVVEGEERNAGLWEKASVSTDKHNKAKMPARKILGNFSKNIIILWTQSLCADI
jgi:hypothetical protein